MSVIDSILGHKRSVFCGMSLDDEEINEIAVEISRLRFALKWVDDNANHAHRSNIRGVARDALAANGDLE